MAHTYFPDTQHMLEIVFQIMFYLTPIMYPASLLEAHFLGRWLLSLNPAYYIIESLRQPILHASAPSPIAFVAMIGSLIVACIVARYSLRWLDRTLVFLV